MLAILFLFDCRSKQNRLTNTRWQTVKFEIDTINYLKDFEKKLYSNFDTSTKLFQLLGDSLAVTYVEGKIPDTCTYKITGDTLFYFYKDVLRDTTIIIKLSSDSLITHRLAGVKTYSVKVSNN